MLKIFKHKGHTILSGINLEIPNNGSWVQIGGGKIKVDSVEYNYDKGEVIINLV